MSDITIITVNWNSARLIEDLLANMHTKAARPERIRALIVDNTNGADRALAGIKSPIPLVVHPLDTKEKRGDEAHGLGLNRAMVLLETEYGVIVDPDIHIFRRDWDEVCVRTLAKTGACAVGAPYPEWKVGKYHDFPSPPFCFFRTEVLRSMKNDWTARSRFGSLGKAAVFVVRQFGRLGGLLTRRRYERCRLMWAYSYLSESLFGVFTQDPGWRLAEEVRRSQKPTVLFQAVMLPGDEQLAPPGAEEAFRGLAGQYELFFFNGEPMLTHRYSSGSPVWRTERDDDETYWRKCIDALDDRSSGSGG